MHDNKTQNIYEIVKSVSGNREKIHRENKLTLAKELKAMASLEGCYSELQGVPPLLLEIWYLSACYLEDKY